MNKCRRISCLIALILVWQKSLSDATASDPVIVTNDWSVSELLSSSASAVAPCDTAPFLDVPALEEAGVVWGTVTAGVAYVSLATGMIGYQGCSCSVSPDGISTNGFGGNTVFTCQGMAANDVAFVPMSLVGKLSGTCALQLGARGWFVPPSTGALTLLVNDGIGAFWNNCCAWQVRVAPLIVTLVDAQGSRGPAEAAPRQDPADCLDDARRLHCSGAL